MAAEKEESKMIVEPLSRMHQNRLLQDLAKDDVEADFISARGLQAMYDSMQFSSVSELHSHMQNTISQMRGDKTVTDTTASVSIDGGGIGLQRNPRGDDDELGLSQLASAVN